ncbi:MAG: hypothetical protein LUO89_09945 [Methanothrix sp.]|nr:hypothetical protein [Methanothrix sp.]
METLNLLVFGRILKYAVAALVLSILVSAGIAAADEVGTITTIAGMGTSSVSGVRFAGDSELATDAVLFQPFDAVEDKDGNVYIADTYNNRVRKVDAVSGTITTVAGNYRGYAGDGGPAVDALLAMPYDLELDGSGNLYICDTGNASIRKIDLNTGIITTVAGIGIQGAAPAGNGGPAVLAALVGPQSIALDKAGNLYIAEWGAYEVRKVDAETGTISVVAGMGYYGTPWSEESLAISAFLGGPSGIAVDSNGNIFIIEPTGTNRISRIDPQSGMFSVYAGNGSAGFSGDGGDARLASFGPYMRGINLDSKGNMYVADANNERIRKIDAATRNIETIVGNGIAGYGGDGSTAVNAALKTPMRASIGPSGNMFIADTYNNRIRKVILASPIPDCPQSASVNTQVNGQSAVNIISWQPPANNSNVTGYKVYGKDAVLVADIAETGSASYSCTDTNVLDCTNYCYSVVAYNAQGTESAGCASVCATTPDLMPPAVPGNLTATATGPVITLVWSPAADKCEGSAAGYKVFSSNNSLVGTTSATTYSVPVAENGSEYCFYVESFDSAGNTSMPGNKACAQTAMALTTGGLQSGKGGGTYNPGSAVPVSFTITNNGLPVGPAEIGNPVPKLYLNSGGNWVEVKPNVVGSPAGLFKYVGNGVWKIVLKMSQAGDYMIMAVPNAAGNKICQNIAFEPVPSLKFTLAPKGKNKK